MSIFASRTTSAPIPIPFDPPHTVTVRKLTGREIEAAQEAHRGSVASGSSRSWSMAFRRMLEKGAADPEVMRALSDPLTGYDRYSLVKDGLVSWSYPESLAGDERQKHIDDLSDEAVDFIATEALRMTKPALFVPAETERKND